MITQDILRPVLRDAALMLVSAAGLGLVYNASSPLGVRMLRHDEPAQLLADSRMTPRYDNETVLLTREAAAPPANTGVRYQNETVGAAVVPGPALQPAAVQPSVAAAAQIPSMTWPQLKPLLADKTVVLVDARNEDAFRAGHIPGAISLPARTVAELLPDFSAKHPKDAVVVVYCSNPACPWSRQVGQQLKAAGYQNVSDLPGGYAEWLNAQSAP